MCERANDPTNVRSPMSEWVSDSAFILVCCAAKRIQIHVYAHANTHTHKRMHSAHADDNDNNIDSSCRAAAWRPCRQRQQHRTTTHSGTASTVDDDDDDDENAHFYVDYLRISARIPRPKTIYACIYNINRRKRPKRKIPHTQNPRMPTYETTIETRTSTPFHRLTIVFGGLMSAASLSSNIFLQVIAAIVVQSLNFRWIMSIRTARSVNTIDKSQRRDSNVMWYVVW